MFNILKYKLQFRCNQHFKALLSMDIFKPTEHDHCKQFFSEVMFLLNHRQLKPFIIYHNANERIVDKKKGFVGYFLRLKAIGMRSGVADYVLTSKDKSIYIEFKRDKSCKLSREQMKFRDECDMLDIPYLCTYEVEKAIAFVRHHFALY